MRRVTNNDWFWIRSNYFNITPQWFKSHFELEANKTRLLRLNIPIHVLEKHDHDLNFVDWLIHKKWSEGFQQLISVAKNI